MTYIAPTVDATGLNTPTYQDYEDYLVAQAISAFGSDIYLENDSQDFQFIAAIAQTLYDTALTGQFAYAARSVISAIGANLDSLVALNGLARFQPTKSIVTLNLTGTAFAVISNGIVGDTNGNNWLLPATVTLDSGGNTSATATAQADGAITALAGQITQIQTPTFGWTSVTNPFAATAGRLIETDAELKARQSVSVAAPSQALTTGILAGILELPEVSAAQLYENDSNIPEASINGVNNPGSYPPHSITVVVSGGTDEDVANAIALRKTPGAYTNGDQVINTSDAMGNIMPIRFYRPTPLEIDVLVQVHALAGYSDATKAAGRAAIVAYINSLVAGQSVIRSSVEQAALSINPAFPAYPLFSMDSLGIALHGNTPGGADININFNQQAFTVLVDVTWTLLT